MESEIVIAFSSLYPPSGMEHFLPQRMLAEANRYQRPLDRLRSISGKLLLREILVKGYGFAENILEHVYKTPLGGPTMGENGPCLSISHSGDLVACAVSHKPVGIDIEILPVEDLEGCLHAFHPLIAAAIRNAVDPPLEFLQYWTRAESSLKALGTGLTVALDRLQFSDSTVQVDAQIFHTQKIATGRKDCLCHVSSPHPARIIFLTGLGKAEPTNYR